MALSQRVGSHLRGNLVAYVALFVALSGTAIALPGKNKVKSNDLARGAVQGRALHSGAVGAAKVRPGAITAAAIADRAVVNSDLADGAVNTSKLADQAVSRAKIAAGTINGGKLANGSVNSAKVRDGSLVAEDFAADQLSSGFERSGTGVITLPRAGRVFVTATLQSTCGTGCTDTYTVEIDDVAVPGASFTRAGDDDLYVTLTGVTANLTAGDHTIELAQSSSSATETTPHFSGILLQ